MFKKAFSLFSLIFLSVAIHFPLYSQNSASVANRRTAIRYLRISKQFASEKLWSEADSNAKMGLAYDNKIADLWYLRAVSQMNQGEKKSVVLPLVVTALTEAEWVDYNKDGARVLYADILCSTRQFTQSLSILDSEPFVYSADAEYIRAKNYYCLGDSESVSKARARLDSARRVYPLDSRFAELFYNHEYEILRRNSYISPEVRSLSDAFSLMIPLYKNAPDDLEIYAAIFASDERVGKSDSKKIRMLKAFNSKNRKSPLYALEALKSDLIDEDAALDYFYQFSDKSISLSILEDFTSFLKTKEVKKEFSEYLNSYNGTITIDTDGDLISNIVAIYKRGRPEQISYDENQDDENEWTALCDFGVPIKLSMTENALELEYSNWPYISTAIYKMEANHSDLSLNLIAETLAWSPFKVQVDSSIKASLNSEFFVPTLVNSSERNSLSGQDLLRAALGYKIPSREREGAIISVSLLNGVAQLAEYSIGGKIYAMAQFENGLPVLRKVDVDGDGLFETIEFYGYSKNGNDFVSASDEMQIMTNLFGSPTTGTGFYIKKITVDRNGDTIPDFTEEYLSGKAGDKKPGKISSWDTDGDGEWDVQYIKYPSSDNKKLLEEAKFHQPLTDSIVTVSSENGIPLFVRNGEQILSVTQGIDENFYWISKVGTSSDEKNIIEKINQVGEQGVSMMVEGEKAAEKKRFLAVRIEKMVFALEIENE